MDRDLKRAIEKYIAAGRDVAGQARRVNELTRTIAAAGPFKDQPVAAVQWLPVDNIAANDYNPNRVAKNEMALLYVSINHDGYTQPIVAVKQGQDGAVIVDGFHRYSVARAHQDIFDKVKGHLPVAILDKPLNDRMASTIRHNRARGKHQVNGMANMVFSLLEKGWSDSDIAAELGMEAEELVRLKHITGFSKLFENVDYRRAWETNRQIKYKQDFDGSGGYGQFTKKEKDGGGSE